MIGNVAHAQAIVDFYKPTSSTRSLALKAKRRGFRYLGGGCQREAFVHINTNIVYKIPVTSDEKSANESEPDNLARVRALGLGILTAPVARYFRSNGVVAMKYIDNEGFVGCDCGWDENMDCKAPSECFYNFWSSNEDLFEFIENEVGIGDWGDNNVFLSRGKWWIIDGGM